MTKDQSNLLIIKLLAEGKVQKEIAQLLNMPLPTVKDRLYDLRRANNCSTTTALMVKLTRENQVPSTNIA